MLSEEEKKAINQLKADTSFYDYELKNGNYIYELFKIEVYKKDVDTILNLIETQQKEIEELKEKAKKCEYYEMVADELSKEIEELKASHITTNNKATNTEKAKIFDVIENSIDTYIEKSKPYWEQIMTKDEMTIDEALTIIDDMYQNRYKIMSQKTEKEAIVDLSKMDYIKFTNLEWASVRALREVQSLNYKFEKWEDKIKAILKKYGKKEIEYAPDFYKEIQSLLKEENND